MHQPRHMGQGDFSHRGPPHAAHPHMRQFQSRGNIRTSAPHPTYTHPGSGIDGQLRFRGSNPGGGHRPAFQRGFPYSRGRGRGFRDGHNQHSTQTNSRDPFGKL